MSQQGGGVQPNPQLDTFLKLGQLQGGEGGSVVMSKILTYKWSLYLTTDQSIMVDTFCSEIIMYYAYYYLMYYIKGNKYVEI